MEVIYSSSLQEIFLICTNCSGVKIVEYIAKTAMLVLSLLLSQPAVVSQALA